MKHISDAAKTLKITKWSQLKYIRIHRNYLKMRNNIYDLVVKQLNYYFLFKQFK